MAVKEKHPHYHKSVLHLTHIDVYRVLERYDVTDPALQHAIKKLLAAGGRGAGKTQDQDVQEAIDSLLRFQEMRVEDEDEMLVRGAGSSSAQLEINDHEFNKAFKEALSNMQRPDTIATKRPSIDVKKRAKPVSAKRPYMTEAKKAELAGRKRTKRTGR